MDARGERLNALVEWMMASEGGVVVRITRAEGGIVSCVIR